MLNRTRVLIAAFLVIGSLETGHAQVFSRPTASPLVTAETANWYAFREPISFAGNVYYPAGARVFFDGDVMERVGTYQGVPIYVDATVEPYSMLLVPLANNQMQPYQRRRDNNLAGTTGSRAPSFPVSSVTEPYTEVFFLARNVGLPIAPVVPTAAGPLPLPAAQNVAIAAAAGAPPVVPVVVTSATPPVRDAGARGTSGSFSAPRGPVVQKIWIDHGGDRWLKAGSPILFDSSRFIVAGEYRGFPVFSDRTGSSDLIDVSARSGSVLTPYRRER